MRHFKVFVVLCLCCIIITTLNQSPEIISSWLGFLSSNRFKLSYDLFNFFSCSMVALSGSGFFSSVSVCFSLFLSKCSMFCRVFSWLITSGLGRGFFSTVSVCLRLDESNFVIPSSIPFGNSVFLSAILSSTDGLLLCQRRRIASLCLSVSLSVSLCVSLYLSLEGPRFFFSFVQ